VACDYGVNVSQIPDDVRRASPRELSDALSVLGAYAEPPTDEQLAAAELNEGQAALAARLANALYGSALAHVMTAEVAAANAGVDRGYRGEAWRAAGADGEGTAILSHYTAMRLSADLRAVTERLSVDLGVMTAAAGAAQALCLLLEVCTVRSLNDPRAEAVTTNLARAVDHLDVAADHINTLFAAARDVASIISHLQ
jgi:transposase